MLNFRCRYRIQSIRIKRNRFADEQLIRVQRCSIFKQKLPILSLNYGLIYRNLQQLTHFALEEYAMT